jgi:alanine or glycine:cation symporter, AGCS family
MLMLEEYAASLNALLWGWPLVIFIVCIAILFTIAFDFIQFRYFVTSWRYVFMPEKATKDGDAYITPLQAFINALSASIGNGSAAGMATAVFYGGPGVGFWIFVLGFFTLAIRFAEVFASTYFIEKSATGVLRGGPMVYLEKVPGGTILPSLYAFFCLLLAFFGGNALQCNSIALGVERLTSIDIRIIAVILFLFLLYLMFGGAQRIMAVAEAIIPIKVGLFFIATFVVLCYHYQQIIPALQLIVQSALMPQAIKGMVLGFTIQESIRFGMSKSINATEVGLGTAAILFGSTASKDPLRSGIMSIASAFISNHLVCFVLVVVLVVSGVWNSGLNSIPLTQAAYETVFHSFGTLLITFLSIAFGLGVLVAYAYIGRECWSYLTKGRAMHGFTALFCLMALFGALAKVRLVSDAIDIVNCGLIVVNLYGLVCLLPQLRKALKKLTV